MSKNTYTKKMVGLSSFQQVDIFRLLVESVKDYAIFMLDTSGHIMTWNAGAARFKGYTADEIIGESFEKFYPTEDVIAQKPANELKQATLLGRYEDEGWRLRKDGSRFWANVVITAIYDASGTLVGFGKVTRDLTDRKKVEENLRLTNESLEESVALRIKELEAAKNLAEYERARIRSLFMLAPVSIAVLRDQDLKYEIVNPAYAKLVGRERASLLGRPFMEVIPEMPASAYETMREVLRSGIPYIGKEESLQIHWDNQQLSTKILDFTYEPIRNFLGEIDGVMILVNDVTNQVLAREQVQRLASEAEAATLAKSQFLANMSHEIRTPLGVILGFADLALDSSNQTLRDVHDYLHAIKRNGEQLTRLLGEVLDLSKVEANKLELEILRFSLGSLLEEFFSLAQLQAKEKGLLFVVDIQHPLPAEIRTDPTRLRQILLNLVNNATKFTEQGSVTLSVRMLTTPSVGEPVVLEFLVADTGIGISEEQSKRLFQQFSQADNSTTRRFGGTGLGLALCRQLSVALGGDVTLVTSEMNSGSIFSLKIPVGEFDGQLLTDSSMANTQEAKFKPDNPLLLAGKKVLLVEDSVDNQFLVSRYLEKCGAQVDIANNGREGMDKATQLNYDTILMDIQMPIMDGHAAVRKLRSVGLKTPILALTAHALKEERLKAINNGFDGYLVKPLAKNTLIDTVHWFCKNSFQHGAPNPYWSS